jgi:hypothetical protein
LKENSKTGKLNPELFTKAVFQKLANYKTNDPQLRTYISKMTNFWNNYHHFFTNMNIELETLRQEIITVKTENQQLRQEITNIKKYLKI